MKRTSIGTITKASMSSVDINELSWDAASTDTAPNALTDDASRKLQSWFNMTNIKWQYKNREHN